MMKIYLKYLSVLVVLVSMTSSLKSQLTLSGASYVETFDGIASGLPAGWSVRTGANATARGTASTFVQTAGAWSTTGAFTNMASSEGLTSSATATQQNASTDRVPAVRQTGSFGDPGAAFEIELLNTSNRSSFSLTLKHQMLSIQPRSTIWSVQYSINSGSSWTTLGTYTDPGTFESTNATYSFGTALDNISGTVLIRVAALTASSGSGNRDTYGIDDFNLTWTNTPIITSNGGGATANISIPENSTAVTTVTATDADGTTPTYAITGGADQALFNINATTGVLTFITANDFENPADADGNGTYIVQVQATDGTLTDVQTITVTITDLTETYYSQSTGDLSDLSTWGTNTDGTGSNPPGFTFYNQIFNLTNRTGTVNLAGEFGILTMAGQLNVGPNITLQVGTGKLVILSSASGTGRIGAVPTTSSITGNVTVERYISSAGNRAYRLLAPSVNTALSAKPYIRDNWQEGTNNTTASNNTDPKSFYGTHITGSDPNLGFDVTQTGQSSLFLYNQSAATWGAIANTNATSLDAKTGYLLYVRGDRTPTNITTASGSTNTTLEATGTLLTGDQPYTLQSGANAFTLVTNPYASPISWASIFADATTTNLVNAYTYWDPNIGTRGGYVAVTNSGTTSKLPGTLSGTPNATVDIQSGQAFFVQATASGSPALTIKEAHKSFDNDNDVFRLGNQEQLYTSLFFTNADGIKKMADGVNNVFNNAFSKNIGAEDISEISNFDENLAIVRNGKMLSIEGRPLIDDNDTIFLNLARLKVQQYELQFNPVAFNAPNLVAYVKDNFLGTQSPISLSDVTSIAFTVTADAASAAANRFMVVFAPATTLPVSITQVNAYQKNAGVQVEWNVTAESNMQQYEVERSANGQQFAGISIVVATNTTLAKGYAYFDANPFTGNNFYRIKAIGKNGTATYTSTVKVNLAKGEQAISIYPNPVKGNTLALQLGNLQKGLYTLRISNTMGQQVDVQKVVHAGGASSQTIQIGNLAKGMYQLQIIGADVSFTSQLIKQ